MMNAGSPCELTGPIIVLGMHRSGTSCLARALSLLGLHLGRTDTLIPANDSNTAGHWEHAGIQSLNRKMLAGFGQTYDFVRPWPEGWSELPHVHDLSKSLRDIICSEFYGCKVWGWKDPLNSILIPWHRQVLRELGLEPHWVISVREPSDVAASLWKRDGVPELKGLGLWLQYTLASLRQTAGEPRVVVRYESLLRDAKAALAAVLDLSPGWQPGQAEWASALGSINGGLNHGRHFKDSQDLPDLVTRALQLCVRASSQPLDLTSGAFDIEIASLWRELQSMEAMLAAPKAPSGLLTLMYSRSGAIERSDVTYPVEGSWRKLSVEVSPDQGSALGGILYHLPGYAYLRNPTWSYVGGSTPAALRAGSGAILDHENGMLKLWLTGELEQFLLYAPQASGPLTFEVEVLVECGADAAAACARRLQKDLGSAKRRAQTLEDSSAQLESRVASLTRQVNELRAARR